MRLRGRIDPAHVVSDEQIGRQANWGEVFGNDRPVQIEIGPGKGTSLLTLAKLFPEHNLLGIEWARKFCLNAARRATFWNVDNIKMLRTDAREFIIDRVPGDSVLAVHVYFPDPWPKARHAGRRFFIPETCRALARILVPGGKLFVATDQEPYFDEIRGNLAQVDVLRTSEANVLCATSLETVRSNYEQKFVKAGQKVFRLAVEKV